MIVKRIKTAVDSKLRKEQAGFRKEKSYSDHFFYIKKHNRTMHRMEKATYINFIDFEKAVDSIHRVSLWKILRYTIQNRRPSKNILHRIKMHYR